MKKQGTEDLWRACFNDTEDFIRLYFDQVYQDENTLVVKEQGRIVAALQLIPYTLLIQGTEIPMAYICGVSTLPEERGKGHMAHLMKEADEELKRRGIPLATLIPAEQWLSDIYQKFGYQDVFFFSLKKYTSDSFSIPEHCHIHTAEINAPGLFSYFDLKQRERTISVLHDERDFAIIRKDLDISGGKLLVAENIRNEITGMAFTLPGDKAEEAFITEIFYDNDCVKDFLLYSTAQLYNATHVVYTIPSNTLILQPKGMAKIIDPDFFHDNNINIQSFLSEKQAYMSLMLD